MRAQEQGEEEPEMVSSFIEFLFLFGHFVNIDMSITSMRHLIRRYQGW
jgi:hypothetical protein